MAYCQQCGRPCNENETICYDCRMKAQGQIKKKNKAPVIIGIIIGVVVLALVACVVLFSVKRNIELEDQISSLEDELEDEKDENRKNSKAEREEKEEIEETLEEEEETAETEAPEENSSESAAPAFASSGILSVSASSFLVESEYSEIHNPNYACDGSVETAWIEGIDGQGEGQYIFYSFDQDYLVSGMTINAGFQKSSDLYYKNSRPQDVTLTFSDGSSTTFHLEDVLGGQMISLDTPVTTSSILVKIDSVYPGNKYTDTAISELNFY